MLFFNSTFESDPGMWSRANIADSYHWQLWRIRMLPYTSSRMAAR
jgi:hypothetical protein